MQYKSMVDPEDIAGCTAIMDSIEARWATADQEIFIAAVILNPFYQGSPFAPLQFLTNAGIHAILTRLWEHFFRTTPPPEFHEQITGYLRGTGLFADLKSACSIAQVAANREVWNPDLYCILDHTDLLHSLEVPILWPFMMISVLLAAHHHPSSVLPNVSCLFPPILHHVKDFSVSLATY
jgi:hypothetical protein